MEVATTTTEAHLSAIHQSLLQISATLGRMLTYGCVNATSSPDAVVPAKCSTVGLNPNIGAVEVVDSSQQSGIVSTVNPGLVGAPPSSTMQRFGILKSGKHTPTTCSTGVLDVDTDAKNAKRDAGTLQAGLSVHVPWDPGVCNQLSREELQSALLEHHNSGENTSSGSKNSDLCAAWVTDENFLAKPSSDFGSFCDDSSGDLIMLSISFPWDPGVFNELGTTMLQSELVKQQTSGQLLITTYPYDYVARCFFTYMVCSNFRRFGMEATCVVCVHLPHLSAVVWSSVENMLTKLSAAGDPGEITFGDILIRPGDSGSSPMHLGTTPSLARAAIVVDKTMVPILQECYVKLWIMAVNNNEITVGKHPHFAQAVLHRYKQAIEVFMEETFLPLLGDHEMFCTNSDSTTVNDTRCFAAYPDCSLDLGDHEMCLFLAISDATILCQEFLQLHTSVASLLPKTRELENSQPTVRQWDPGIVKPFAMRATETSAKISKFESSLHDSASEVAFVSVIWHYQIGLWDLSFQEELVYRIPQEARSRCYFCMQSRLFGFSTHQQCNLAAHDGIPWDPGGVHGRRIQAIAWGQAMFFGGGIVTPGTLVATWAWASWAGSTGCK